MKREMLLTSVLEGEPVQCLRVPGPSFMPMIAAAFLGSVFIFATFKLWTVTVVAGVLATAAILVWLWRGTALIPEKPEKHVGLGLELPLYRSGPQSIGWWAMFITMTGDVAAFVGLIFGYYYFFTIHADFPPPSAVGPGVVWPSIALALFAAAWVATRLALARNRGRRVAMARLLMGGGAMAALLAAAALLWGPYAAGLDPAAHVYPATVWVIAIWTAVHGAAGALMLCYCLARSLAGRMTPEHDIDIANVALYWNFTVGTALVTVATLAYFPLIARAGG
jgi:cytochrome c oxidase subunit I+III